MALESRGLSAETRVTEVWPKFPLADARFSHLLSHQCGLAALDRKVSIFEHAEVVEAIEAQTPAWILGENQGYHPRTYCALTDEPVRRLTGKTLGSYWQETIADPLGLDFWIGLPESEWPRVARLYPGKAGNDDLADAFYKQLTTSGTFTRRAFSSPRGLHAIHADVCAHRNRRQPVATPDDAFFKIVFHVGDLCERHRLARACGHRQAFQ